MKRTKLIAKLLRKATKQALSEEIVDWFILSIANINEQFCYAAKKVATVDPLIPASVLTWVVEWVEKEEESLVISIEQILKDFESRGYEISNTSGYINIYGPKFPQAVFVSSDEQILRGLGFRLRTRPDSAKGYRSKWWITREDYAKPIERSGLSDEEIHARFE